ncbi:MAG: hypothetical protein KF870_12600 [Leadbetterella sp.]|nr:hypothetical protein [Leadbetterella sp.]
MKLRTFRLLLLALLVFNCKNDDSALLRMNNPALTLRETPEIVTLSVDQLRSDPVFVSLVRSQKLADILDGKAVITLDNHVFKLDLKEINKFSGEEYTSYTFNINRGKDSKGLIENLVIENSAGKQQAYILSYQPDEEWIRAYVNNKSPRFKGRVGKEFLNPVQDRKARTASCTRVFIVITTTCPRYTRAPGDDQDFPCEEGSQVISFEDCNSEGGGPGPGGFYDPREEPGLPQGGGPGSGYMVMTGRAAQNMAVTLVKYFLGIPPYDPNAPAYIDWLTERPEEAVEMLLYLQANNFSTESLAFALWAFNYINVNLDVTWDHIRNWFLTPTEGQDHFYDDSYWSDPSLTFPAQSLPSWSAFQAAFPKKNGGQMPSSEVYSLVGGALYNNHLANPIAYSNACAVRVSRGLNYSGVTIPEISGQTEKGADNKNYFLSAKSLNAWMRKTFGTPTGSNHLTGSQGGTNGVNFPNLLQGKKGIYIMIANYPGTNYFGATGHADILESGTCPDNRCYFNPKGGVYYIDVWPLN